jgi:hypothetical protein
MSSATLTAAGGATHLSKRESRPGKEAANPKADVQSETNPSAPPRAGKVQIPLGVLDLPASQRLAYIAIASHVNSRTMQTFVGMERISRIMRSSLRTTTSAVASLVQDGLVESTRRGRTLTNLYTVPKAEKPFVELPRWVLHSVLGRDELLTLLVLLRDRRRDGTVEVRHSGLAKAAGIRRVAERPMAALDALEARGFIHTVRRVLDGADVERGRVLAVGDIQVVSTDPKWERGRFPEPTRDSRDTPTVRENDPDCPDCASHAPDCASHAPDCASDRPRLRPNEISLNTDLGNESECRTSASEARRGRTIHPSQQRMVSYRDYVTFQTDRRATDSQLTFLRDLHVQNSGQTPSSSLWTFWAALTPENASRLISEYQRVLRRGDMYQGPLYGDPAYEALSAAGKEFADNYAMPWSG